MKKLTTLILLLLSPLVVAAEEDTNLLCIAENAGGFAFNQQTKEWDLTRFSIADAKYIFSKGDDGAYTFTRFGERYAITDCKGINENGWAQCDNFIYDLTLNVLTLRYRLIYPVGYVTAPSYNGQEGDNSPSIEIGKCSKF